MLHFIKRPNRNCWFTNQIENYRVTVEAVRITYKQRIVYLEVERLIGGDNDYYYLTIYYEKLDLCTFLDDGFCMKDIKYPFIRELKKVAMRKIREDQKRREKCL